MNKIDLVIPYVNNNDRVWQNAYLDICIKYTNYNKFIKDLRGNRYDDNGLFELNLMFIKKNMPWINNIYLLVSNKEQVPHYAKKILKDKLKVVLHQDFIYGQYLPTFNSTTIEMFLWNIKGLEEHFIYINDDMFPIKPLKPSNFFSTRNNRDYLRLRFLDETLSDNSTQFKIVCHNSHKKVYEALENRRYTTKDFQRPIHSFTPMLKSHCKACYKKVENNIKKYITRFRTEYQVNQYIYPLYEKIKYAVLDINYKFRYVELKYDENIVNTALESSDIVCINDNGKTKEMVNNVIKKLKEKLNV